MRTKPANYNSHIMTQKVRKGEELPEVALKVFLRQHQLITNQQSPWEVSQYSTGFSNLTYLIKIEGKELILRRPPRGAIKRGHDMGREYKVLTGLNKEFDKAPQAYIYTENVDILGAPFYLMEKVEGIILTNQFVKQRGVSAEEFRMIFKCWLDTFVELHAIDYEAISLGDLGRPVGYVARQVRNWGKQYLAASTEEIPEAKQLMTWLTEHQPTEYDHCLIHNDYKYDNVVFADDSWQSIRAILDWEMCTLGDPLMDLGAAVAYWITDDDDPLIRMIFPYPTALPGNPTRSEVVQRYSMKSGRQINDLIFYYSFGLFKNAVIVQQIYYRYQKGLTSNEKFAKLNKVTKLFCQMAWKAVQNNRIE